MTIERKEEIFMKNKGLIIILSVIVLISSAAIYIARGLEFDSEKNYDDAYSLNLLILHHDDGGSALMQHLSQSLVVGVNPRLIDIDMSSKVNYKEYDLIYLHGSIKDHQDFKSVVEKIEKQTSKGAITFVDSKLASDLSLEFTGVREGNELDILKTSELTYPEVKEDLKGIQEVVSYFYADYKKYIKDEIRVKTLVPEGANIIVGHGESGIISVNQYDSGKVLVLSNFLPNYDKYITSYDFKPRGEEESFFHYFYASANSQIMDELMIYAMKEKHGIAFRKTLGVYGRPVIAWQNHYEVSSSIKNKEMIQWIDILREYDQVPTFSLVRGAFEWGKWQGTITYHKNIGQGDSPIFNGEEEESYYGAGVHIKDNEGKYITFGDYPEYTSLYSRLDDSFRPYNYLVDWNNNGKIDILVGTPDGKIALLLNEGEGDTLEYSSVEYLKYKDSRKITIGNNLAPTVIDFNKNGLVDLVVGTSTGDVYLLLNSGTGFLKEEPIKSINGTPIRFSSEAAPFAIDFDGDGNTDLIVGDGDGYVYLLRGTQGLSLTFEEPEIIKSKGEAIKVNRLAAPHLGDYNQNGQLDLLIGDGDGNIHVFLREGEDLHYEGKVPTTRKNIYGENTIYGGKNVVPFLVDYNNDGKLDLVTSQLEFGLAYDVSSDSFPYKEELYENLNYALENHIHIMPHIYFHGYKDKELQYREVELHKESFKKLGLPWDYIGTNQHTWRINMEDPIGSFESMMEYGIWNNFGFRSPYSTAEPRQSPHYLWPRPFIMMDDEDILPMVLSTPAPLLSRYRDTYDRLVKMDMPLSFFEHVEYKVTQGSSSLELLHDMARLIQEIRREHNYSFVTEEQMAKAYINSILTEYKVNIDGEDITISLDTSKVPEHLAKEYLGTGGLKVELGEKYKGKIVDTNELIQYRNSQGLYIGVIKDMKLRLIEEKEFDSNQAINIISSNVPIKYNKEGKELSIYLDGKGMKEIRLYSERELIIDGKDLKVSLEDNIYTIIHYGEEININIR